MAMLKRISDLFSELDRRVAEVKELPPIPEVAEALLRLQDDPSADAKRLANMIELDPSLSAQIMKYAGSAFFGYRGRIDSIQDAISRVLGFDKTMHIAIGLAAGSALHHSQDGPLGLQAFWRHALYSAVLMQELAQLNRVQPRPSGGLLYLSGLVHNIGFLLLGYLLESEFDVLNAAVAAHPDRSVTELERELLGMTHDELAVGLLRQWKMPREVLTAVLNHHNEDYQGEYAVYANLTLISDRLLKRYDIGDAPNGELPEHLLRTLGFSEMQASTTVGTLMESNEGVEEMVRQVLGAK